jgi:hypothetical protein
MRRFAGAIAWLQACPLQLQRNGSFSCEEPFLNASDVSDNCEHTLRRLLEQSQLVWNQASGTVLECDS